MMADDRLIIFLNNSYYLKTNIMEKLLKSKNYLQP